MKEAVVGFLFNQDKDTVVLLQKTHPKDQAGRFNGPGGQVVDGEEPSQAMAREFLEETGVVVHPGEWRLVLNLVDSDHSKVVAVYTATWTQDRPIPLKTVEAREERPREVAVEFALQFLSLVPDLKWMLPLARDGAYMPFQVLKRTPGGS